MAKWRDNFLSEQAPLIEANQLDKWLELPVDDRTDMSLAFLDALMVLVDDMVSDDQYIQIGTTQNKSAFVFALKGKTGSNYSIYKPDFIRLVAQLAGDADAAELDRQEGRDRVKPF